MSTSPIPINSRYCLLYVVDRRSACWTAWWPARRLHSTGSSIQTRARLFACLGGLPFLSLQFPDLFLQLALFLLFLP